MTVINCDCLEGLRSLPDNCVDAIVTDPPYGLSFMGKKWDYDVPTVEVWAECLRVLKPGGHLLAFAGTRTQHRMAVRIEDAGFEIRDMIAWVYGSGFPKSLDVSKAIDKARDDSADILRVTTFMADAAERIGATRATVDAAMGTSDMAGWWLSRLQHRCQCPKWDQWIQLKQLLSLSDEMDAEVWRLNGRKGTPGNEREIIAERPASGIGQNGSAYGGHAEGATQKFDAGPATDDARQWQGWGTALKPALEPITVARKPLAGTVAANVLEHGTGALNIDGCRVGMSDRDSAYIAERIGGFNATRSIGGKGAYNGGETMDRAEAYDASKGRWPANLIHDGSDEVLAAFPNAPGQLATASTSDTQRAGQNTYGTMSRGSTDQEPRIELDKSAARFFYCAKASSKDRGEGNNHPTVKPTDLMRYLCRLVTPPGGLIVDPFAGSGSTGKAAKLEGFCFIGYELDPQYAAIANARCA